MPDNESNSTANNLECCDYQPIMTIKCPTAEDMEIAEDAGCDTCTHFTKGKCHVYQVEPSKDI